MNTFIDFNHWQGSEIGSQIMANEQMRGNLQLIESLKPRFCKDGNQFCFILGEMPEGYLAGFGDTVHNAVLDFSKSFYTQKL